MAIRGENGEGYGILGIYESKSKAEHRCVNEQCKDDFMSCDYTDVKELEVQ